MPFSLDRVLHYCEPVSSPRCSCRPTRTDDAAAVGQTPGVTRTHRTAALLLCVALVLLAGSLRTGITSLTVLLPTVRDQLHFSATGINVLTTLPPLCFAVVGIGTGRLVLRYGVHKVTVALLATVAGGLIARSLTDSWEIFLLATVVTMAGIAVGNVVLPPLTKQHFPQRIAAVSALYGAALVGGAMVASVATVPIADATGGWRSGLAVWAVVPILAVLLWLPTVRRRESVSTEDHAADHRVSAAGILRTRLGWAFIICFGTQSVQAYIQFGWWGSIITDVGGDDARAGLLLGIIAGMGIPMTLLLPVLIRRTHGSVVLPVLFAGCSIAGWIGILLDPLGAGGGVVWALLLGIGSASFTWVLAMIADRSRTPEGTSQLSSISQGAGYLIAAVATFGAGVMRDALGNWDAVIVILIGVAVAIGASGAVIARSGSIEDAIASP